MDLNISIKGSCGISTPSKITICTSSGAKLNKYNIDIILTISELPWNKLGES